MKQTNVTVVGHVATEPHLRETATGIKVTNFRLATTERRYDRGLKQWRDGDTMFFSVACWRALAENVHSCVRKGQPVIIEGRLHTSSYDDKDGATRVVIEIEASTVGHDLTRGVSAFTKADLGGRAEREIAEFARDLDRDEAPPFDPVTGELLEGDEAFLADQLAHVAAEQPGA